MEGAGLPTFEEEGVTGLSSTIIWLVASIKVLSICY
jgi:hypothetical protein